MAQVPGELPDKSAMAALYPHDLQLKQAILIHRHGARTPVHKDVSSLLFPGLWRHCSLRPALSAIAAHEPQASRKATVPDHAAPERPPTFSRIAFGVASDPESVQANINASRTAEQLRDLHGLELNSGECFYGQLTDKGKQMMQDLGSRLRELYISRLGLLPPKLDTNAAAKNLYLRSTDYARTIESLQYLLHGLYPTDTRDPPTKLDLQIHVRTEDEEDMYPKDECAALAAETKRFRDAFRSSNQSRIQAMLARFPQLTPAFDGATHLTELNKVFRIYDTLKCAYAHGEMPSFASKKQLDDIEALVVDQWARIYSKFEVARLAIGRFVGRLAEPLQAAASNKPDAAKMLIFSGHDSTLVPFLSAFNVFKGQFPSFSSHVAIELFQEQSKPFWRRMFEWRNKASADSHFVRLSVNGVPRELPACAAPGKHRSGQPTLCTLDAFLAEVKRINIDDYESVCRSVEKVIPDWD